MKSTLAAVKRQRFPSQASRRVRGLFILSLGFCHFRLFLCLVKDSAWEPERGKAAIFDHEFCSTCFPKSRGEKIGKRFLNTIF